MLLQDERCLLILVNNAAELPADARPLPVGAAKRKRADILAGSCIKLEPLAPGPGGLPRPSQT